MAIDVSTENLIRIPDVPKLKWLPRRRAGRKLHISTVFRWIKPGLNGHRLEVMKAGGALVTTEAALVRFFEKLADVPASAPDMPTPRERQRQIDAADARLAAAGI